MGSKGNEKESSQVPIVDFFDWIKNTSADKRLAVAKELTKACREVGFVYITNHGLPPQLLDEAFAWSKRLFDLPHEEKMQAPHPDGFSVPRGYSHIGLEKIPISQYTDDEARGNIAEDFRESFDIGWEKNTRLPNVWLPEQTLPGFREFALRFSQECHRIAMEILRAVALGIGLEDANHLVKYHSGTNDQLRLLHYPPLPAAEIEQGKKARMPAHCDWSTMTMLFQDDCGGLEVADPHSPGKFVSAPPIEGACIMNIGDLLMRWSNDDLKSTRHRVSLPPLSDRFEGEQRLTRARYSIPYFVAADSDTLIECLPACTSASRPIKYKPVTQEDYLNERAEGQYETTSSKAVEITVA